jgi:hypothetical protein
MWRLDMEATYLGVVIDHDSLLSERVEGASSVNGAPIELDRASDAVHTGTKNKDAVIIECDVVRRGVVGGVKVVSVCA